MSKKKSDHAQYLASSHWQTLRKQVVTEQPSCERCSMPRWLASIAYDQDLNVHHKSYANLGAEELGRDLEVLCRRCHEIETFGRSGLREPKSQSCEVCQYRHWDPYACYCPVCAVLLGCSEQELMKCIGGDYKGPVPGEIWHGILWDVNLYALRSGKTAEIDAIWKRNVESRDLLNEVPQPYPDSDDQDIPF